MFDNLDALKTHCLSCTACPLAQTRTNVVFGVGNPQSEILVIGEGPGENEDLKGEPFVGRSGQLLDKLLATVDLSRKTNIYIANMVKCRPPQNRDPKTDEVEACIGYLHNQIALMKPKIILCLGRVAACYMIDKNYKVTKQHGQWFERDGIWMTGTFHPAALLRSPANKPDAFEDFIALKAKILELTTTDLYQE